MLTSDDAKAGGRVETRSASLRAAAVCRRRVGAVLIKHDGSGDVEPTSQQITSSRAYDRSRRHGGATVITGSAKAGTAIQLRSGRLSRFAPAPVTAALQQIVARLRRTNRSPEVETAYTEG